METLVQDKMECNFDIKELFARIDELDFNTDLYSLIVDEQILSI